jgi:hypothetical protein
MNTIQTSMPAPPISVTKPLFNPFYYLAGGPALGVGLALIVLTGVIGFFANTHVDGVLDMHTGREAALWVFLSEGLVNWLLLSILLFIAGKLLSSSSNVRALDIFGTQALARAPYVLASAATLLPGFQRRIAALASIIQGNAGEASAVVPDVPGDPIVFMLVTTFNLLMLAWMVALMYRAYAYSCNLKGSRAVASFIVVLIVAEFLSKVGVGVLLMLEASFAS